MNSFQDLEKKLSNFKQKYNIKLDSKESSQEKNGFFVVSELIAATTIGGFIGYNLDKYFNTKAVFLFIMILLGVTSAFYNIYRKYK
ncbi:MAG: AtpZ/AtpI family protein [Rickettsiales bacterium]